MPLEPQRILITGAYGFVGRHLLTHLLDAGVSETASGATAVVRSEERPAAPVQEQIAGDVGLQIVAAVQPEHLAEAQEWGQQALPEAKRVCWVGLDITEESAVLDLMARIRPQAIYHLAARASGADSDRDAVFAVNVSGTRNLLEAASHGMPFPRVLLISTGYVYGNTSPERPAREEDPIGPLWRYGAYTDSKIEMESVARSYRGFALVARAFSHTGPGQTPTYAIPSFARQLARIENGQAPPELHVGNLEARRDLLDVRDVVRAYRLLMSNGVPGEVYNIATGQPKRMQEILDRLRALCTKPTEVVVDPKRLRPAEIDCSTGTPALLQATTGWQPRYTLEQTLRDTLDFWRVHDL